MIYDEESDELKDVISAYNKISKEAEEAYRRLVPDAEDFEAPTWDDSIFGSEEDIASEEPQATSVEETLPEEQPALTTPTEKAAEQAEPEEDFSYSEQTQHWRVMSSNMENGGYEAEMSAHDKNIELQKSAAQDAEYGYDSARKALEQAVASNDTSLITEAEKGVEAAMKTREEARARYLAAEADKKFDDEIIQAGSWMGESEYEEKKALNRKSYLEKENADLARRTQRAKLTSEVYANVSLSTPGSSSILTDGTVGRVKQEYGSLPSYASSRINGRLDSGTIDISRAKARIRQDIVDGKAYTQALASYAVNKKGDKAQTVANEQTRKLIRDATSGDTKRADKALDFLLAAAGTLEEEANATLAKSRDGNADYNDNEFIRSLAEGSVETAVRGVDEDASLTTALQSLTEKVNDRTLGQAFGDRFQNAISLWDRDTQAERIATAIPAITSGIVIDQEGNVALSKETMQQLGAVGAGTIEGGDSVILDAKRVNYIKQKYGVNDDQLLAIVKDKAARSIAPDIDKTSTTTGLAMMIPVVDENGITRKSFELNPNVVQENGRYLFNNEYIEQTKVYIKKAGGTKEDLAAFDEKLKQAQYEFVGRWHQILMDQMSGYDNYYDSIKGNYANARDAQIAAMTTYDQSYWRAGVDIFQESLTSVVGGTTSVVGIVGETGLTLFGSATTGLASEVFKAAGFRDTAVLFNDINKGVKTASYYTFGQAREAGRFLEEYASRPDAFRSGAYTAGRGVLRFAGDLAVSGGVGSLAKKGAVKVATKAFAKTATSLAKKKAGEKLAFGEKFWLRRMASVAKDKKGFSEFASNAAKELGVRGEEATQALTNYAKELASDPKVLAAKVAKTAPKQKAVSAAEATAKRDSSSIVGNTIADEGNARLVSNLSPATTFDNAAGVANLEGDRLLIGAMTNAAIKKLGNDAASASMQAFFGGQVASSVYSDIIWQKQNEYLENYCAEHGITREELAADKEKEEEIKREAYFDASSRAACFAIFSGVISNAINFNLFTPERTVLRKVTGENTFTGANSITARTTVAAAIDTIKEASGGTLTKAAATQIVAKTAAYAAVNSLRSGFYGGLSGFIDTLQQAVFESIASGTIDQIDMETLLDSAFESATVGAVLGTVSFNLMQQGDNVFYNETSGKIQKLQGQIDASIRIEKERRIQDSITLKSALEKAKTPEERASLSERIAEKADELRELDMLNWMNLDQSTITRLFDQEISPARTEDKTGLLDIQESLLKAGAMLRLRGMQRAFNRRAEETREFLDNIGASPETSWMSSLIDSMVYRDSTNETYARSLDGLGINEDLMSYDVSRLKEISTEAANFEYSQKASDGSERTLYEMREDLIAKKKATELAQANKQKQKPEDVFTEYDDAMLSEIDNAVESARALKKYVDFLVEMKEMDARNNEAEAASRATPEELSVEKAARELVISSREEELSARRNTEEMGEETPEEMAAGEQDLPEKTRMDSAREKATSSAQRLLALADRANEARKKILEANRELQSMPYEARFKNADQLKARQEEIAKETENLNSYREQLKAAQEEFDQTSKELEQAKDEFVQASFEFIKGSNEGKLNEAVDYARQKLIDERNRLAEEMPTADEARARAIVERSNEIERQLVDLEQNGWRAFNDSNFDALIGDRYEARTASKEGILDRKDSIEAFGREGDLVPVSDDVAYDFFSSLDTLAEKINDQAAISRARAKSRALELTEENQNRARELGVFDELSNRSNKDLDSLLNEIDNEIQKREGSEDVGDQAFVETIQYYKDYVRSVLEFRRARNQEKLEALTNTYGKTIDDAVAHAKEKVAREKETLAVALQRATGAEAERTSRRLAWLQRLEESLNTYGVRAITDENAVFLIGDEFKPRTKTGDGILNIKETMDALMERESTIPSVSARDTNVLNALDKVAANREEGLLADSARARIIFGGLDGELADRARTVGVFDDLAKLSSEEIEARISLADEEIALVTQRREAISEGADASLKLELDNYIKALESYKRFASRMREIKTVVEGYNKEVASYRDPFSEAERQSLEKAKQASEDADAAIEITRDESGLRSVTPKENGVAIGDATENNPLLMEKDKRRLRDIKRASQKVEAAYREKELAAKEARAATAALTKINPYDRIAGADEMYNELLAAREASHARLSQANEQLAAAIKELESLTNKSAANAVDAISRSLDNSQYLSSKLEEIMNAIRGKVTQGRRRAVEEKAIKSIEARSQKDSAAISSAKVFAEEAKSGINQKEYLVGKRKAADDVYQKVRKLDPRYGVEFNRRRRAALAEGDPSYNIVTFAKEILAESQNFFRLAEAKTPQEFKRIKESLWVRERDNRFKVISDSNARKKIADLEALRDSVEVYDAVVKKYDDSVAKYKDAINKVALENEAFNRTLSPQVIKEVVDSGLVDQLEFSLTERQGQTELAKINPFEEGSSASIVFNEIADIIDSARLTDGSDYRPLSEREITEKLMRKVVPDEAIEKEPGKYRDTSDALRTKVVRPMLQNLKDSGFVKRMRGNQYKGTDKMFQQKMPELTSEDVMTTYEKTAQQVVVGPDSQIGEGFTVDSLFKGNEEPQKFDVYFNMVELPTEAGDANGHAINKYYANEPDNFRLIDNQDKLSPEAQNMITEMGFDAESQPTRFFTANNMAKMSTDLGSGHYNIAAAEAMMKAMGVDMNNVFVRVVYSPNMQADSTQGYYMNVSKPGETPVHVITLSSQLFEQGGPGFVYDVIVHELGHAFLNKLYTSRKGFSSRLSDVADELRSNVSKNFETIKRGFLQRIAPLDDATRSKAWSMFVNTMYGLGFDVVPSKDGTTFEIVNSESGYNPQEFFTVLISNNMMPWILNIKGPYAMKVEVGYAQMVSGDVALRNWLYSWGSSGLIDSSTTQSVANALTSYINSEAKRGEQDSEGAEAKQIVSECLDPNAIKQTASSPDEAFENFAWEVGASEFAAKAMSDRLKLQMSKPNENGIDAIGADHPYFKKASDYTDNDAVIIETPDGEIAATAYDAAISKNIVNFTANTSLKYRGKKTPFLAADGMYKFELNANDSGFIRPYEGEDGKIHDYKSFLQLVPFFRDKGNRRAMDNYLPKNVKIRLGDVYDYPELFDLYPDIADIRIIRTDELSELNANGAYDPTHNELYLSSELGPSAARAILLHELQHVIQIKERTPIGGNPSEEGATTFYITSVNEITKVRHYKWGNPPQNKLSQEVLDKWKEVYKEKIMKIANSRSISEGGKQFALIDKGEPLTEETRGLSIYHRLYGEAEARAVAKRRNYTQEERKRIPFEQDLGIAADELIIAYEKPEELFAYFVRMASRDYNDKNLPALLQSIDYDNVGNVADNPVIDVYYNKVHFENNRPERSSEQFSSGRDVTPDDIANYDLSPSEASPENVFALVHQFLGDKLKGERVSLTFARLEAMMEDPSFLSGKFDEQSITPEFVSTLHFLLAAAKQNGMIIPENMWRIMNSNSEKNMGDLVEAFKIFLRGEDGKVDDNVARSLLHGMLYIVKRINHRDVVGNASLSSSWAPTITFKAQDALRLVQDQGKLGGKRINSTGDLIREKKKYGLYVESLVKKVLKPVNYTLKALGLKEKDLSKEDAEAINEMKDVGVAVERNARAEISRLSTAMSRMADNFDIAISSVPEEQRKELAETIGKALGSTDAFISHADRVEIETRNKDELRAALKNIRTVLRELSKATEASKNDLEKQLVDIRKRIDEAEKNSDVTDDYIKALEGEDSVISSEVESLKGSIAEARMLAQEMVRLIKVESAKKLALDLANKAQETAKRMRAERAEARQKLRTGFDGKAAWVVETVDSMRKLIDDSVRDLAENRTSGADVIKRGLGVYLRRSYAPYTGKRTLDRAERIAEILSSVPGDPSYELSVRVREHFAKDLARKYVDDDVSVYANVKAKAMAFRAYKAMAESMDGGEELLAVIYDAYEKADKAYAASDVASIISKQAVSDISRSGPLALAKSGYNDYWAEAWKEATAFDLLRQTNINRGYKDAIDAAGSLKDYQIDSSILRPEDVFTEALAQVKSKSDHATLASLYSEAKRSLVDQGIKKLLVDEGLNLEMFSTIDEQGNRVEPDVKTLLTKIAERIRNNQSIPGLSEGMANTISRHIGEADSFADLPIRGIGANDLTRTQVDFETVSESSSVNYLEYNLERIALRKGLIDGVNRDDARRVYKKLIDNQDQNFIDSYIKTVFDSNKSGGYDENDALLSRRNDLPEPVRQMLGEIKMNNLAGLVDTVNLTLANINRTARKNKVFYDLLNSARAIDGAIIEGARPDATGKNAYVLLTSPDGWVPEDVYKPSDNIWIKYDVLQEMKNTYYRIFSDANETSSPYERMEKYPGIIQKMFQIYTVMPLISGVAPTIRNYAGMIPMTIAPAGLINRTRLASVISNQSLLLNRIARLATKQGRVELGNLFQEFSDLGIIDSNFMSLIQRTDWDTGAYPEIQTVLETMRAQDGFEGFVNKAGVKVYEWFDKAWTLGQKLYSLPDNVGKIVAYESNLADLSTFKMFQADVNDAIKAALQDGVVISRNNGNMHLLKNYMSEDKWTLLHDTARERSWYEQPTSFISPNWIKANIPIRKKDPAIVKKIKKALNAFIPLQGPYLFFHYSMMRSVLKNVQFGAVDFMQGLKTKDFARAKSGISRALSAAGIITGPLTKWSFNGAMSYVVTKAVLAFLNIGVDDDERWEYLPDENESLYLDLQKAGLIPPWYDSETCFIFFRRNKEGKFEAKTWSSSFVNPYAAVEDIVRNARLLAEAYSEGDNDGASDYAAKIVRAAAGSTLEASMFMSAFIGALQNSETNKRIAPEGYETRLMSDIKAVLGGVATGRPNELLDEGEKYSYWGNFSAQMLKGVSPDIVKKTGRLVSAFAKDNGSLGAAIAYFFGSGSFQDIDIMRSASYALFTASSNYSQVLRGQDRTTPEGKEIVKRRTEELNAKVFDITQSIVSTAKANGISKQDARTDFMKHMLDAKVRKSVRREALMYFDKIW